VHDAAIANARAIAAYQFEAGSAGRGENRSSWGEFLLQLHERGLSGVEFVVSDDHAHRYLSIDDLREHKKETLLMAA
jgi:hypothetical protein